MANLQKKYDLYIDGKWVPATAGATLEAYSPVDGKKLADIAEASREDVDHAVEAAQRAFETWKLTSPAVRQQALLKIADIIEENLEHLATIESMDNGKPIRETMAADIPLAADHFRYFAGAIRVDEGSVQMLDNNTMSMILREPIGVVGQIIPWNFPFLMAAWKLAPALAAGCTVVLKPSSHTSLSVLELARLIDGVLPQGVLNVITGAGSKAGEYILQHKGFNKLAFTGSTAVGQEVYEAACSHMIPATLELGGKSANIFFEDADWDMAMDGLQLGILFNQGQVCSAGSRVFVQDTIYDKFVAEAKKIFEKVRVGNPLDKDTQMGALIYEDQLKKVLKYVEIGKKEGATLVTGGERITEGDLGNGYFMQPTIFADVTNDMQIAQEEIFGPVVVIQKFHDEEEVIRLANDSIYGLGGGVFTRDLNRAIRVSRAIETGRIWINSYNNFPAGAPFGGYKQSGIGRETHKVILDHYTQMKNLLINLNEKPSGFYETK
ncbi:MAG: aldehyde dehydrogenase family protein [Veillonellaceae bacterium]|nr:aldehyde dehydrogenase family protein [Veillonellaceae bacterium]